MIYEFKFTFKKELSSITLFYATNMSYIQQPSKSFIIQISQSENNEFWITLKSFLAHDTTKDTKR